MDATIRRSTIPIDGNTTLMSQRATVSNIQMSFENADNGYFASENLNPGSATQLYSDGLRSISAFIDDALAKDLSAYAAFSSETSNTARLYSNYDRFAAAAWAGTYSSNPTTTCKCGNPSPSVLAGYSQWANTYYPYHGYGNSACSSHTDCKNISFCHDDCANFVSQCMREGHLPIEVGAWNRVRSSVEDIGTIAWRYVSSMKTYMVTTKGYWTKSNFTNCNLGNPFLTSSGHVVINTKNDTVTRTYNGHTNDRKNAVYTTTTWEFYIINSN